MFIFEQLFNIEREIEQYVKNQQYFELVLGRLYMNLSEVFYLTAKGN